MSDKTRQNKATSNQLLWPRDFVWGVSTSSFQVEGAVNDDGRGASIWDTRCRLPDKVAHGGKGDIACDHYHRYKEDVALIRELGIDDYRFSLAWPRILPEGRGRVNAQGLAFYDRLLDELLNAGITPWVCLYHWDLPQALQDRGGWTHRDSAGWFADYTALVTQRYGDRVKNWVTFNEFAVFTLFGYAMDWAAPGQKDREAHLRAIHHVNLAHGTAVDVIRTHVKNASIGAIHNLQSVSPCTPSEPDRLAAELLDVHWNKVFPDAQLHAAYPDPIAEMIAPWVCAGDMARICQPIDWFGFNHYGPIYARAEPASVWGFAWGDPPPDPTRTGPGPIDHPEVFRDDLIAASKRYGLPVYVTENGCGGAVEPDAQGRILDTRRVGYLTEYTQAMHDAIAAGADVRGYFIWSLMDSFEWGAGYTHPFGIVHVDFETQARTMKLSGQWYKDFVANARGA